jgi:hypothetical protein
MIIAPICLFTYKRPWHTQQTVAALQKNELASESDLIIYSDAAKTIDAAQSVREVRGYIRTISGFRSVSIIEREENYGLAKSIIAGVTEVVNRFGRVIVLEDDLVTSPFFLRYMNDALTMYNDEENVVSIHGYIYPVRKKLPETFFLKGADCWGWATWKRGWDLFEADGQKLINELEARRLTKKFDFDGAFPYTQMLRDQIEGKNDSWAVRWYASAFLDGKLTLYPGTSLVRNIGLDSSGTHCSNNTRFDSCLAQRPVRLERIELAESPFARDRFILFLRSSRSPVGRVWKRLMESIQCVLASKN